MSDRIQQQNKRTTTTEDFKGISMSRFVRTIKRFATDKADDESRLEFSLAYLSLQWLWVLNTDW